MTVNEEKLNAFLGKVVGDVGATMSAALVVIGDKLGLYRALAAGPQTPAELAKKTETAERYVRGWLNAQAASGYVEYDAATRKYHLEPEQAMALADDSSPASVPGLFHVACAMWHGEERITENFRSGGGLAWGAQHTCLFEGTERFFRSGYVANLMSSWIPALSGVQAKLEAGAKVADVGCGLGASTILMAKAFPKSKFFGFDSHGKSVEAARQRAEQAGVADRVTFEVAKATDYPGAGYNLAAHFDCLHDMEDRRAAKHVRETLAKAGSWIIVEPSRPTCPRRPQPRGARLLLGLHDAVRPPLAVAGRSGARRASGRIQVARGRRPGRRLRNAPARDGDALNIVLEARL